MPFGDYGSFDPSMFGDLGGGDIFAGDPSWPGDNFAFGDTSDSSNILGMNDGYQTQVPNFNNPSETPGGLGMGGLPGMGGGSSNWNFNSIPWAGLIQMLGGLTGYSTSQEGIGMTKDLISKADPWGSSGGRAAAGQDLMGIMGAPPTPTLPDFNISPDQLANTPGYKAGLDAITRADASRGFLNSGNMMADMFQYGGGMYDKEVQNRQMQFQDQQTLFGDWSNRVGQLGHLAGGTVAPNGDAPQLMGILGQAEASKNASIISGVSGIANALRPQAPAPAAQGGGGGSGGGGGGDDGFGSMLSTGLSLLGFL